MIFLGSIFAQILAGFQKNAPPPSRREQNLEQQCG